MIDERPVRLAIEKVIAKHQVLWVLEQLNALPRGEHVRYCALIADLAAAWATWRAIAETPRRVEQPRCVKGITLTIKGVEPAALFNADALCAALERTGPGVTVH